MVQFSKNKNAFFSWNGPVLPFSSLSSHSRYHKNGRKKEWKLDLQNNYLQHFQEALAVNLPFLAPILSHPALILTNLSLYCCFYNIGFGPIKHTLLRWECKCFENLKQCSLPSWPPQKKHWNPNLFLPSELFSATEQKIVGGLAILTYWWENSSAIFLLGNVGKCWSKWVSGCRDIMQLRGSG